MRRRRRSSAIDAQPGPSPTPDALAPPPPPAARPLTGDDVRALYAELLGRLPAEEEIANQLAGGPTLRQLLQVVLASDEYGRRRDATPVSIPHVVNTWCDELGAYTHQPGSWSPDGVAVMGRNGWIFLGTGTNAVLDQYRDGYELPPGWAGEWGEAVRTRREETAEIGAAYVGMVVPDKLAVLTEHVHEVLAPGVRAPAVVLSDDPDLGVLYPVAALAAVPGGAYLRTDTHLTYAGNATLARVVLDAVGVSPSAVDADVELVPYLTSGDLGNRFLPPVVEVVTTASTLGAAVLVEDNEQQIRDAGGHIGTRRVLRNEHAEDPRTAVLFGDSYGYPAAHYQGIGWFLAQAFREVHAVWVPFGWDRGYVERAGAQVVVCEAAERFVVRPPAPRVDVLALAEQTIAHGRRATAPAATSTV